MHGNIERKDDRQALADILSPLVHVECDLSLPAMGFVYEPGFGGLPSVLRLGLGAWVSNRRYAAEQGHSPPNAEDN